MFCVCACTHYQLPLELIHLILAYSLTLSYDLRIRSIASSLTAVPEQLELVRGSSGELVRSTKLQCIVTTAASHRSSPTKLTSSASAAATAPPSPTLLHTRQLASITPSEFIRCVLTEFCFGLDEPTFAQAYERLITHLRLLFQDYPQATVTRLRVPSGARSSFFIDPSDRSDGTLRLTLICERTQHL